MPPEDAPSNAGYAYRAVVRQAGTLLDFLSLHYPHSAREVWAQRLAAGQVEVQGRRAQGGECVRAGQVVVWHRPPWREETAPLHFGVLHEDSALLAVNKPSGLPTLPGGGFLAHTLLSLVRAQYPGASPLHRLGRGTSGVVLFARTGEAGSALARAWRDHEVTKVYRALSSGEAAQHTYDITAPIGPVPHPRLGTVYAAQPEGKPSVSRAQVRRRTPGQTLFDVQIATGRPHQIRIHLASIGHPLVGDPLYGAGGLPLPDLPGLPGDLGYWLHAWTLGFRHPVSGQHMLVEAEPPPELQ
ncbi:RluA family pseudouridine synthase [Deinococcus sp. HMF7604]|uniref:RluA family pseudouridine synthase n=1 Tax=Deinococcus betulae TaxID=2873312 RepID=UPI001CCB32B4|nr:RluA family pseudouridine synthase [Deinococcus betulae]MBZ9750052.1 RluA family pseudouridine synthase [Deinococcus betulae]